MRNTHLNEIIVARAAQCEVTGSGTDSTAVKAVALNGHVGDDEGDLGQRRCCHRSIPGTKVRFGIQVGVVGRTYEACKLKINSSNKQF